LENELVCITTTSKMMKNCSFSEMPSSSKLQTHQRHTSPQYQLAQNGPKLHKKGVKRKTNVII
jgi:hypothetical protein